MALRARFALAAALIAAPALVVHLSGPPPAAAATSPHSASPHSKPTHSTSIHSTPSHPHRAPAREPVTRPHLTHAHLPTRHAPAGRHKPRAGGLLLAVSLPGQKAAHAASDPGASIVDFSFSPATITIHVGDTITWTNVGKAPHTATAYNHSFDTGVLQPGRSGSHTFTTPGTYTYFCIVHPFMKGTVVVLANAPAPTTPGSTTPAPGTSTATTSSAPGLPNTGLDLVGVVACGAALTGLGFALRRRLG